MSDTCRHHAYCPMLREKAALSRFLARVNDYAMGEAFIGELSRLPLDWGKIVDDMKQNISLEAIAYGMSVIRKRAGLPLFMDGEIMKLIERSGESMHIDDRKTCKTRRSAPPTDT